jgi:hypothetical protein
VSCISEPGTTEHFLTPLSSIGGNKLVTIKVSQTTTLNIEYRAKSGVDKRSCSEGLLLYLVDAAKSTGQGPYKAIDPRSIKGKGCNAQSGPLSGAAMDFSKGEKDIDLPEYGVKVTVSSASGGSYRFSVKKT